MKALVLVLGAGLLAFGCSKQEPAPAPVASVSAAAPAAPAASVAADPAAAAATDTVAAVATDAPAAALPAAAVKAIPTETDYEVQATSAITKTNAAQVLAAIDKQVGN